MSDDSKNEKPNSEAREEKKKEPCCGPEKVASDADPCCGEPQASTGSGGAIKKVFFWIIIVAALSVTGYSLFGGRGFCGWRACDFHRECIHGEDGSCICKKTGKPCKHEGHSCKGSMKKCVHKKDGTCCAKSKEACKAHQSQHKPAGHTCEGGHHHDHGEEKTGDVTADESTDGDTEPAPEAATSQSAEE